MTRFVVGLLALLALIGLGLGIYSRLFPPPPLADVPTHKDDAKPLSPSEKFEELAKNDPVAMLDECLTRYQREVKDGFSATLIKNERPNGDPAPPAEPVEEVIKLAVRGDAPASPDARPCVEVVMKWQSGAKKFLGSEIRGTLFSEKPAPEGTGGKIRTWRPEALVSSTNTVPANDSTAQSYSRYCIRDAGVYRGMLRTYEAWKKQKEAGTLSAEYLGKEQIEKAGGRVCYVVRRTCRSPEVDAFEVGGIADKSPENVAKVGFTSVTIMIDVETWLQVGTELYRTDADGKQVLIGAYYFRDVDLHPHFTAETFTEAALKAKK
jgi:Protein of unknown function (DUF1571)